MEIPVKDTDQYQSSNSIGPLPKLSVLLVSLRLCTYIRGFSDSVASV